MQRLRQIAAYFLFCCFTSLFVFHSLILLKIVPATIVWGGQLKSQQEIVHMESSSLLITLLLLIILIWRIRHLKSSVFPVILRVLFYLLCLLFTLNTVGNILSASFLERIIFTPITLLSAISCWILARKPNLTV
jgi:hypothetical protein